MADDDKPINPIALLGDLVQTPLSKGGRPKKITKRVELFAVIDTWSPKSDRHSLEHPIFSIAKTPDLTIRHYSSPDDKVHLTVFPSVKGSATIWDKDILLYVSGLVRARLNAGEKFDWNEPFEINCHNLLSATSRNTGGRGYELLEEALDRLSGTRLKTDIETGGKRIREAFGIIDSWGVVERNKKLHRFEIKLSEWFFNSIVSEQKEVLSINKKYFELVGGVERRIYEICRKHCGQQGKWEIGISKLRDKCGGLSELKSFRRALRAIVLTNEIPDYLLTLNDDKLCCYSRNFKGVIESLLPEPPHERRG